MHSLRNADLYSLSSAHLTEVTDRKLDFNEGSSSVTNHDYPRIIALRI